VGLFDSLSGVGNKIGNTFGSISDFASKTLAQAGNIRSGIDGLRPGGGLVPQSTFLPPPFIPPFVGVGLPGGTFPAGAAPPFIPGPSGEPNDTSTRSTAAPGGVSLTTVLILGGVAVLLMTNTAAFQALKGK